MEQYEVRWKDYYAVLGVSPCAEPEVVRAAYTALARKHHPDAGGDMERMKSINGAYEILSDPFRKTQYDACHSRRQAASSAREENQHRETKRESQNQWRPPPGHQPARVGILPWPSWRWQRIALFCSFPLGLGIIFFSQNLWLSIAGIFLLFSVCYAAIKTRGLNKAGQSGIMAKLTGGFSITVSLLVLAAAALMVAAVAIVIMAFVAETRHRN